MTSIEELMVLKATRNAALVAFVRYLRALDADSLFTMYLTAKRQAEREREVRRPDIMGAWELLAEALDARYTEAERAA